MCTSGTTARESASTSAHYFSGRTVESAVGEVDPDYMYCEQSLPRIIQHLNPDILKVIFIFRNPVERAFSQYLMNYRRGHESLSFEEAIATESSRIRQGHMANLRYSYATRGYYLRQVERFLQYIDRSRMLFLLSETLETDPVRCVQEVYRFLNVEEDFEPRNIGERFHQATAPRSHALARRLEEQGFERRLLRRLIPSASLRRITAQRARAAQPDGPKHHENGSRDTSAAGAGFSRRERAACRVSGS